MARHLFSCSLAFLLLAPLLVYGAQTSGNNKWQASDMVRPEKGETIEEHRQALDVDNVDPPPGRGEIKKRGVRLKVTLDGTAEAPPSAQCDKGECVELYYFRGETFKKDPKRKSILYIPGGPGDIPPKNDLEYFANAHNVFYFHPRGAGLSTLDGAKSFDKFLRAGYIARDIELIRMKELGDDKWDAIYGYSYGTVIAQKYAHEFPDKVKRLILSAPVHRRNETEEARRDMVLENLVDIYRNIRFEDPNASCNAGPDNIVNIEDVPKLKKENIDVEDTDVTGIVYVFCEDDFSFLHDSQIRTIKDRLKKEYDLLEDEYGSLNLINLNYDQLEKDTNFTGRFPYPREFFIALRQLQSSGAPREKNSLVFIENVDSPLVTSAMVVGYYSMFDRDSRNKLRMAKFPKCDVDLTRFGVDHTPFLDGVESLEKKKKICARIDRAMVDTSKNFHQVESRRALYVLGLYDGINRWIFDILEDKRKKNEKCDEGLRGEDIQEFMQATVERHKMLREEAGRIGIVPGEAICPWDPGQFKHKVQTLILKGGADTIIAKKQAEDFFQDGLDNLHCQGVLIEFPGMGHDMFIRWHEEFDVKLTRWGKAYRDLVEEFIKPSQSAEEFRKDKNVIDALKTLKAKDTTPFLQGVSVSCPK